MGVRFATSRRDRALSIQARLTVVTTAPEPTTLTRMPRPAYPITSVRHVLQTALLIE